MPESNNEFGETKEISFRSIRHIVEAARKKVDTPEKHELILVIRGMIERVKLPEDKVVTLGRSDPSFDGFMLDLTAHQAVERGVSRVHAKLHMQGDDVFLTDLDSRNGTFINGKRIEANKAVKLCKGHEIQLGNLPIQVMFRS